VITSCDVTTARALGAVATIPLERWPRDAPEIEQLGARMRDAIGDSGYAIVRGAAPLKPAEFEAIATLACGHLVADNGEHDRVTAGTASVFTPTAYSSKLKILWHNENSFLDVFPARIAFGCVTAAETGGETPVLDNEELAAALDPGVVSRFRDKGITYVRRYVRGIHRTWREILRSDTRAQAEQYCTQHRIEIRWDGDVPTTTSVRPAFCVHPEIGREVLVAQPLHWHPRALPPEMREQLFQVLGPDQLPRHCTFGDGTEIADSIIDEIAAASAALERSLPWRPGDILAVDNLRTAHARNPYHGARKLLVAMGRLVQFEPSWTAGAARLVEHAS
jgi:alpha-ketoglutarate-dependent taurine dioxygenase